MHEADTARHRAGRDDLLQPSVNFFRSTRSRKRYKLSWIGVSSVYSTLLSPLSGFTRRVIVITEDDGIY